MSGSEMLGKATSGLTLIELPLPAVLPEPIVLPFPELSPADLLGLVSLKVVYEQNETHPWPLLFPELAPLPRKEFPEPAVGFVTEPMVFSSSSSERALVRPGS